MPSVSSRRRPDYGLDAPPVVRNLLLAGVGGLAVWASAVAHLWSGAVQLRLGSNELRVVIAPAGRSVGVACVAMALWMIWSSRVGKLRERERLLDTLGWRGDELVLDVGCGRGLMLVGAARRLRTGAATGIDLWRSEDLAGNLPAAVRANAEAEGVGDRVGIETADMRDLPFASGRFDVILSRAAVHNLVTRTDRRRAVEEMARVLRPGGTLLLADIRHLAEYAAVLRQRGLAAVVEGSPIVRTFLGIVTFGALRPGAVRATAPGAKAS